MLHITVLKGSNLLTGREEWPDIKRLEPLVPENADI
jgi:hypothetical protein